jgi:uncharacterized protein YjeT (DUF2065 family)
MGYLLSVLGTVFVLEAVPYILFPAKVKYLARVVQDMSDGRLQAAGVVSALLGLIVVALGRAMAGM